MTWLTGAEAMVQLNGWERVSREGEAISLPGESPEYEVTIRVTKKPPVPPGLSPKKAVQPPRNWRISKQRRAPQAPQALEQVLARLRNRALAPTSGTVKILVSRDSVGRILASIPTGNHLDKTIGPFYDATGLSRWKGMTRQGVHQQMQKRQILGLRTSDREIIYPAWQFDKHGAALPQLREVLEALDPAQADPWGAALWLRTPAKRWGGRSPAELLRAGRADEVLEVAQGIRQALSS